MDPSTRDGTRSRKRVQVDPVRSNRAARMGGGTAGCAVVDLRSRGPCDRDGTSPWYGITRRCCFVHERPAAMLLGHENKVEPKFA